MTGKKHCITSRNFITSASDLFLIPVVVSVVSARLSE